MAGDGMRMGMEEGTGGKQSWGGSSCCVQMRGPCMDTSTPGKGSESRLSRPISEERRLKRCTEGAWGSCSSLVLMMKSFHVNQSELRQG